MFLCNLVSLRNRISFHSNHALNTWAAASAVSVSSCKESILDQTLSSNISDSLPSYYDFLIHTFRFSSSHTDAKQLHLLFIKNGLIRNFFCSNTIKAIYVRTGDIFSADKMFDEMPQRNCTCTHFIETMRSVGFHPSSYALGSVLKACIGLDSYGMSLGLQIHGLIMKTPYAFDVSVSNVLILMYGNNRNLVDCACRVFDEMHIRDVISWNSIISVFSHRGDLISAFEHFSQMQLDVVPNEYTFGSLLAVASSVDYSYNRHCLLEQMLGKSVKFGIMNDLYVGSALVSGLTRVGLLDIAKSIFQQMNVRNVATMNGLMVGLVKQRQGEEATIVFRDMEGMIERNSKSYSILMSSFTAFSDLKTGKKIGKEVHAHVMRAGLFDSDVSIGNALINMYAKCGGGDICDACSVFELMVCKDSVSWNTIISIFDQNKDFEGSVVQFHKMRRIGLMPSNFTFISALSSCGSLGWINMGKQIHGKGIQLGLDLDISVSNVLICLYSMTGFSSESLKVFSLMSCHDRVSWNSIIRALADSDEAIVYFIEMMRVWWSPNDITLINVLSSVSSSHSVRQVHTLAVKYRLANETTVENALLSCYGKSGYIDECEKIFSLMSERRNEIAWNSMILSYIHNDQLDKAMDLVSAMLKTGERLDSFTFATVLSACASISMLERGMEIHGCSIRADLESDVVVGSALVDMYAKCGKIDYAVRFFNSMPHKNLYTWNAMISGFASHGLGYEALELFTKMTRDGNNGHLPDHVTFVAVLSACSHVGLVEEGFKHFESMSNKYNLTPRIEHFSCMVDVLGRAGELHKMDEFIKRMPIEPNELVWRTVLAACSRSNDLKTDLGREAAKKLMEMEPKNAVNYVLVANMYAAGENWVNVEEAREAMRESTAKKETGCSWFQF